MAPFGAIFLDSFYGQIEQATYPIWSNSSNFASTIVEVTKIKHRIVVRVFVERVVDIIDDLSKRAQR